MGKSAIVVVAATFLKMLASGCIVRGGVMRKRTRITLRTIAFEEPTLADGLFLRIMNATTRMSSTYTYSIVRNM
jgi:hypothetical protein